MYDERTQRLRRVTWARDELVLTILPEQGGKLETLRRRGGPNVLFEPPDFPPRPAPYGAAFEQYDTSGWDECFPTIAPCPFPGKPEILLPDHGELWSAPWSWKVEGASFLMEVSGTQLPYRFRRTLSIRGSTLRMDYEIASEVELPFLWSAHPLLAAQPGGTIQLPSEVGELWVEGSNHLEGERFPWPREGYSLASNGCFKKLFTDRLREGWASYKDPSGETVLFRWDPQEVPFLGLWICEGGWPTSRPSKHFTVALEPCTGRHDSLFEAAPNGPFLSPGIPRRWTLEVTL